MCQKEWLLFCRKCYRSIIENAGVHHHHLAQYMIQNLHLFLPFILSLSEFFLNLVPLWFTTGGVRGEGLEDKYRWPTLHLSGLGLEQERAHIESPEESQGCLQLRCLQKHYCIRDASVVRRGSRKRFKLMGVMLRRLVTYCDLAAEGEKKTTFNFRGLWRGAVSDTEANMAEEKVQQLKKDTWLLAHMVERETHLTPTRITHN